MAEPVIQPSSRWGSQLLTTSTANTLLDLPRWRGQRTSTFTFEVIDFQGQNKGWFHPVRNRTPRLSHDSTRTVSRSLELTFTPSESILFDVIKDRLLVTMVLSDGTKWPLGKYMSTDSTNVTLTSGNQSSVSLVDEMFIIDQKISNAFAAANIFSTFTTPRNIKVTINILLQQYEFEINIEETEFGSDSSWSTGTSRARILKDLAQQGGYLSPWFNNRGALTIIKSFDPASRIPTIDLDVNDRVIRNSPTTTNDLLTATNRFIVASNSGLEDTPRVGVYNVPASAPYSAENRGFVVPEVYDIPVESESQAYVIARSIALQQKIYETVELETTIDPRHDGFDVVRWDGKNWLELDWSMDLVEGGTMRHTMRRIYI